MSPHLGTAMHKMSELKMGVGRVKGAQRGWGGNGLT